MRLLTKPLPRGATTIQANLSYLTNLWYADLMRPPRPIPAPVTRVAHHGHVRRGMAAEQQRPHQGIRRRPAAPRRGERRCRWVKAAAGRQRRPSWRHHKTVRRILPPCTAMPRACRYCWPLARSRIRLTVAARRRCTVPTAPGPLNAAHCCDSTLHIYTAGTTLGNTALAIARRTGNTKSAALAGAPRKHASLPG